MIFPCSAFKHNLQIPQHKHNIHKHKKQTFGSAACVIWQDVRNAHVQIALHQFNNFDNFNSYNC